MKRLLLLLLLCVLLSGCNAESAVTPTVTSAQSAASSQINREVASGVASQQESVVASEDIVSSADSSFADSSPANTSSAQTVLSGASSVPSDTPSPSSSATASSLTPVPETMSITKGGEYALTGTKQNVTVRINAPEEVVTLTLSGATVTNANGPALYIAAAKKVNIILAKGTKNILSDGSSYSLSDGTTTLDAALFSRSDLHLSGEGSLQVTGNYKHGIVSKDDLVITSGTYQVTAKNVALEGKDCVKINGGTLTLQAGSDGIRASNTENSQKGYITVENGVVNIQAGSDGLQAATNLTVKGGELQVSAAASGVQVQGNYLQTGGTVTLFSPHGSGKAGFNVKTASAVEGGTLLAFGDSAKARHLTSVKNGCALLLPFAVQKAGTPFTLTSQNKTTVTLTPKIAYSSALVYTPALTPGEYTLTLGTTSKTFTVNTALYILQ